MSCDCFSVMLKNIESEYEICPEKDFGRRWLRIYFYLLLGKMHIEPETDHEHFFCNKCGQGWLIISAERGGARYREIYKNYIKEEKCLKETVGEKCACASMVQDPTSDYQTFDTTEDFKIAKDRIFDNEIIFNKMWVDEDNFYLYHCRCGQDWAVLQPNENRVGMIKKIKRKENDSV